MINYYDLLKPAQKDYYSELLARRLRGSGGIEEIEGVPPLTFQSDGTPLLDYLISGNMSQTGTPTPDSPIMPEGTGERTGNLIEGMFGGSIGTTGGIGSSDQFVIYYVPVTAGETYTISGGYYVYAYYADKPTVGISNSIDNERHFTSQGNTITVISGASWIGIRASGVDIPMVNTGSTPLPYEPYGYKIPILNNSQTTNVYLGEVQSTRRIKQLVLTGEENWVSKGNPATFRYENSPILHTLNSVCYCSHFKNLPWKQVGTTNNSFVVCYTSAQNTINIRCEDYSTVEDFKAFLAAQYSNGTPVTVWYVLATPTTGIVNEPLRKIGDYADTLSYEQAGVQIPTNRGNTIIDVGTELKPSEMYIKYQE